MESLNAFGKHSITFVDSTFLRANLGWPTTVTAKPKTSRQKPNNSRQNRKPHAKNKNLTAKPKTSRQKQKPHGKTENLTAKTKTSRQNRKPHGKNKNLTAKPKTSRLKRKPHGKTENLTAKTKTSRQNRKFCLFCFCHEVFGFAVRHFVFAVTVVGHPTSQILILNMISALISNLLSEAVLFISRRHRRENDR